MPTITIHVTPLSYRILNARYGAQESESFKIDPSDFLNHLLCYNSLRPNRNFNKESNELTCLVKLDVSKDLHRHLSKNHNNIKVGLHLHRYHKEQLNFYIATGLSYGDNRMGAQKRFCDLHNVSEDDFALMTAYKSWQRNQTFLQKNSIIPFAQMGKNVQVKRTGYKVPAHRRIVSFNKILRIVNDYYECGLVNLLYRPIRIKRNKRPFIYAFDKKYAQNFTYQRAMLCYLLSRYGLLSTKQILSHFNFKDIRVIQKYIADIKAQVKIYDDVKIDIKHFEKAFSSTLK